MHELGAMDATIWWQDVFNLKIDLGLRASASCVLWMGTVITLVYVDYTMQRFICRLANQSVVSLAHNQGLI